MGNLWSDHGSHRVGGDRLYTVGLAFLRLVCFFHSTPPKQSPASPRTTPEFGVVGFRVICHPGRRFLIGGYSCLVLLTSKRAQNPGRALIPFGATGQH